MERFENQWRSKIQKNTEKYTNEKTLSNVKKLDFDDQIEYTKELIHTLKTSTLDEKIQAIFCKSACHIPHEKLEAAKLVYKKTNSIEATRLILEEDFKKDIKEYKNLTDEQVAMIIKRGWGLAGVLKDDKITATKIPSKFHEYFLEEDPIKKKYYYCHCPRIRHAFTEGKDIDSIYCNCGGGFYQDVWEYITEKEVDIHITKSLFDGDDVCQFEISITNNIIQQSIIDN